MTEAKGATVMSTAAESPLSWETVALKLLDIFASFDYSIAFGALAGSLCFVVTAKNLNRRQVLGYFIFSYAVGISGASFVAHTVADYLNYKESNLDMLAAVLISAVAMQGYFWIRKGGLMTLPFVKKFLGGDR